MGVNMFSNNNNMLFILILLLVFSFTGQNGINDTESLVLIFTVFALLLSSGTLFGSGGCGCSNN